MKKFLLFCVAVICLLACEKVKEEIPVTSVTVSQPTAEMIEGETIQLRATVKPDDATDKTITWASSKQSVATISDSGLVTAVSEGSATITATAGGKTGSCQITVSKRVIEVTSISLNKEALELVEGEEETLAATVLPENVTNKTVEWTSSSPDIALVDGGKVKALKEGEATITAKAGSKSASCQVVVTKKFIAVESVELNKTSLELLEGNSDILVATVKPDDATDKTVTWISSDEEVVSVDDSGKVKALKEGKATIAAKAGEKTATCEVTVSKKVIPVESITLDRTEITMTEDESTVLTATVKPDDATDKTVTWSSSDTEVAIVNDGRITSVKEGKAVITAKAGEKEATCVVMVNKRIIEVTSITLNYTDLSLIKGDEQVLVATVLPDNATNKIVTWTSSNVQVAKVDNDGKVTAIKSGTAIVTAKAGEKTATCEVTVTTPVESITLDRTSMTLEEGQSTSLIATVTPNDADKKTVSWRSSDANVVTVDQSGKVKAIKEGTATITASAGGQSATCSVSVQKQVIQVESITLNKTSLSLEKGQSEKLVAIVKPDDATDKTVNWSSSDASVASVDQDGKVTALKSGNVTIMVKAGEKTATCQVTVTTPVESVTLDKTSLTLDEGQSATLVATVKPDDATDKTVIWSSSDASVASVDQNGKVTALKSGSATITAKAGEKTATCEVKVTTPVESVTLDRTALTLEEGQTTTLVASVNPSDADDKTVSWSSSNTSVASVDQNGKVTAVKEGTATITATAGGKSAFCSVSVKKEIIQVTSVTLNKSTLSLEKGQSETLVATVKPDDATDKTVNWSSSDLTVARVDNTGKVTAIKSGSTTITAKAGEQSATCSVTVTTPVESVTLDRTSLTLEEGQTATLVATVSPGDADDKTVSWSSSNKSVATVDNNGTVTAVKEGTATITASAGGKSATCALTVQKKEVAVTSVSLNKTTLSLTKGQSETLVATVKPDDAADKTVTWSSSDASVASVDQNGKVTALKSGNATIMAKAGEKSATCSVSVSTPVESVSLDQSSVSLDEGQTVTLVATVSPGDADDKTVSWSSSNASVASVDQNGKVTAVKEGTATITASAGGKSANCAITVTGSTTEVIDDGGEHDW